MRDTSGISHGSKETIRTQAWQIIYPCLCSFVVLLICTRSSPLYAMNNWDDVNSYFTMGKGMMNGLVPYRDLFDQKGILLYFLYGLAYLISRTTHIGVFLLEWIAASLCLMAVARVAILLCEASDRPLGRALVWALLPLCGAFIYSPRCMWYGGSAEELMLPLFAWGLVLLFETLRASGPVWKHYFVVGILTGCVFHIKFNSLGFFFGWMAAVVLLRLGKDHLPKTLRHILVFFAGVFVVTLPWLVYFLVNRAVGDWFKVTLWLNLTVYSEKLPWGARLYGMLKTLYNHFLDNPGAFVPAALGVLWFFLARRFSVGEKLAVLSTGAWLGILIFIGGVSLPYYPLPLAVYALFFVPAAVTVIEAGVRLLSRTDKVLSEDKADCPDQGGTEAVSVSLSAGQRLLCVICFCVAAGISAGTILRFSMNPGFLGVTREDLFQYKFRDDIIASGIEHPTLINMGCFDVGLYTVADIVPNCYFFQTQTIHLDDVYLMQRENIRQADTDFVLSAHDAPDGIDEHYEQIDEASWDYFGTPVIYYLYQREGSSAPEAR